MPSNVRIPSRIEGRSYDHDDMPGMSGMHHFGDERSWKRKFIVKWACFFAACDIHVDVVCSRLFQAGNALYGGRFIVMATFVQVYAGLDFYKECLLDCV